MWLTNYHKVKMTRSQAFWLIQQCSLHYPYHPIPREQVQQWKEIQNGYITKIWLWEKIYPSCRSGSVPENSVNIEKRMIIANVYREIHPGTFSFCKLVKLNPDEIGKNYFFSFIWSQLTYIDKFPNFLSNLGMEIHKTQLMYLEDSSSEMSQPSACGVEGFLLWKVFPKVKSLPICSKGEVHFQGQMSVTTKSFPIWPLLSIRIMSAGLASFRVCSQIFFFKVKSLNLMYS